MLKHRILIWSLINAVCLVLLLFMIRQDHAAIDSLLAQNAADRWASSDKEYVMTSVFLDEPNAIPQDQIDTVCLNVENELTMGGVGSDTYPWIYAVSSQGKATLSHVSVHSDVELNIVSGDYFIIHPMSIINGGYISDRDLMHDRIVLDEQTAWELFYSTNVVGQYLELNGVECVVAAVINLESGRFNELAEDNINRAWILSDCPAVVEQEINYTCLEMILPEPLEGFALSATQNAFESILPYDVMIVDQSKRFSLSHRWYILRHLTTRGISENTVVYPYWEKAAQLVENNLARRLVTEFALFLVQSASLVILLFLLTKKVIGFRVQS